MLTASLSASVALYPATMRVVVAATSLETTDKVDFKQPEWRGEMIGGVI